MCHLIAFLREMSSCFGCFICDDLESDFPLPPAETRQEMKRQYYKWIDSSEEQDVFSSFEHPFTTYSDLLGYFAYRLNPDIEQQICQEQH